MTGLALLSRSLTLPHAVRPVRAVLYVMSHLLNFVTQYEAALNLERLHNIQRKFIKKMI